MKNFLRYSKYYDILYREKNYPEEVRFVQKIIQKFCKKKITNIISLGCGSGNHELLLAKKGYKILGIDRSKSMLALFDEKIVRLHLKQRISLKEADLSNFNTNQNYDCAISLFNVVGYQTENDSFEKMLRNINKSLKKGGIFTFDCWHAPAVLKDKPTDRVKEITDGDKKIIRLTTSKLDLTRNVIEITFKVFEIVDSIIKDTVVETHPMRYWSIPELRYFLEKAGFELVAVHNFLDFKSKVADDKWDIFITARKIK